MHKYEMVRIIGQGAFGNAYLAIEKESGNECVVKRVDLHQKAKAERENIFNEVRVLQNLLHPNIVGFHESFDAGQMLHIVMQHCEGGDLGQCLDLRRQQRSRLEQAVIVDWASQIALAIFYLHDRRILHRDLKTPNIFLQGEQLKLGDFGISKVLDESKDLASTNIGTPYYMSPQQYRQKPYSYKSDMWAFGCILYQMCNLKRPFEGATYHGLAVKVLEGRFAPVSDLYSQALRDVVRSLLNKQSRDRPTIVEFLHRPIIRKRVIAMLKDNYQLMMASPHTHTLAAALAEQAHKLRVPLEDKPQPLAFSRSKSEQKKIKEELQQKIHSSEAVQKESKDKLLALALLKREEEENSRRQQHSTDRQSKDRREIQNYASNLRENINKTEEELFIQHQKELKIKIEKQNALKQEEKNKIKKQEENKKRIQLLEQIRRQKQQQERIQKQQQLIMMLKQKQQMKKIKQQQELKIQKQQQQSKKIKQQQSLKRQKYEQQLKRKEQQAKSNIKQKQYQVVRQSETKKRFKMQQDYDMNEQQDYDVNENQLQAQQSYDQKWEQESKEYDKGRYLRLEEEQGNKSYVREQIMKEEQKVKNALKANDQLMHTLREELSNIDYFILSSDEEQKRVRNPAHVRISEKVNELNLAISGVVSSKEVEKLRVATNRAEVEAIVGAARAGTLHIVQQTVKLYKLLDSIPMYL